jgi:hypothetical protein
MIYRCEIAKSFGHIFHDDRIMNGNVCSLLES